MSTQQFDEAGYKSRQRQEWDSVAAAWKKWWPFFERGTQQVNARLAELTGIQAGYRVLDISTGTSEPAVTIARLVGSGGSVVATDQSPGMLAIARERIDELGLRNVELLVMDTEALEVPEEEFDSAVCRWGIGKWRKLAGGQVGAEGGGDGLVGVESRQAKRAVDAHEDGLRALLLHQSLRLEP